MHNASTKQDGLTYVLYKSYGDAVEIHKFSPDLQTFPGYYDVATDLTRVSATSGIFVSADFLGRGYDQLAYVLYNGSNTSKVEVHLFNPSLTKAIGFQDIPSILPSFDPTQ